MKAIFFRTHGDHGVLEYGDLPEPVLTPGHAIVRVRAVALNHLDIWVRRGWKGLRLALPHVLGSDVSGEIYKVDTSLSAFRVGDAVIVNPGVSPKPDSWTIRGEHSLSPHFQVLGEHIPGGMAEYCAVPLENIYKKPASRSFPEAAAPLLVATTCWRMLLGVAKATPGQILLVVGSGGGVNSLSIQIARAIGMHIICLAGGPAKASKALALGAHHVIDYHLCDDWPREVLALTNGRGADVVVDNVGQATMSKSMRAASRGGSIVTVGNTSGPTLTLDNRFIFTKQLSIAGSTMGSPADFEAAQRFLLDNDIQITIDSVHPLSAGIEQLGRLEKGDHFGKIVLTPPE